MLLTYTASDRIAVERRLRRHKDLPKARLLFNRYIIFDRIA